MIRKLLLPLFLSLIIFGISCNGDDNDTVNPNEDINNWIYSNMDFWYYWTDLMPPKPSTQLEPADFYESLLVSGDRFSFIYDDYEELVNLLNGVSLESGFEFKLYLEEEGSTNVIMQLIYIKKDSPADDLGLKRGDIIYQINGTQLTDTNFNDLIDQMQETYTATYRRYNENTASFEEKGDVSVTPIVFSENPVLLDSVYEIGGKKIGYLVYTFFSPGTEELSDEYDQLVDNVFADFQSKGIDNLVLDLRFNGGGSVSSAINLASLIVNGADAGDLMLKREYNDEVQAAILDDPDLGSGFLTDEFLPKEENVGGQLSGKRVYVLTTGSTASASEMVINALRPFMDVYTVGETTVGKDVGSITISDTEDPENNWALQPIVLKFVNSANQDYPSGFSPDLSIEDNQLVLEPLGDIDEPLLSGALNTIGVITTRISPYDQKESLPLPLENSIDKKAMSGKIIIDTKTEHINPQIF